MTEFYDRYQLGQLYDFLTSGSPSLLVQLLVINTLMFMFFIWRRVSIPNFSRRNVTYTMQWVLVAANFALILQQQWIPFLNGTSSIIVDKVHEITRVY